MQIGTAFQMSVLTLLRPAGGAEIPAQGSGGTAQAGARDGARDGGHRHHGQDRVRETGHEDGRLQSRMEKLSALLQRLTAANPDAQGASYAAIVLGRQGTLAMAAVGGPGQAGDTLVIQAQEIRDVSTGAGDDAVTLRAGWVSGIYTGGGPDAVAIVGTVVSGIHTDAMGPPAPPVVEVPAPVVPAVAPPPGAVAAVPEIDTSGSAAGSVAPAAPIIAGNDALSIAAYLINDVATGGGDDAVALAGRIVANVDAGAGNDAVAIKARVVTGVTGGDGDDAIAVDAGVGVAGVSNAEAWFAQSALVATNGDVSASVGAAKAYADVDGGAGNDVISVRTASVLAVAGGAGDDTVNVAGGTVSLVYGAGDGRDTVNVAAGAQVVLQIGADVTSYSVEFAGGNMVVTMGEGSVTFAGIGAGTVGIKHGDAAMALITQPGAGGLNLAV